MIVREILIPGNYEEAYLYQGHLILITCDRDFVAYAIDDIVIKISERLRDPLQISMIEYLFCRNDWFASDAVKKLLRDEAIANSVADSIADLPGSLVLHSDDVKPKQYRGLGAKAEYIFDIEMYRGRLYLATNIGLIFQDLDWASPEIGLVGQDKKLDARCISMAVGYGVIEASCGDEGLHVTTHNTSDYKEVKGVKIHDQQQVATRSVKSSWTGSNIMNYSEINSPELFRTQTANGLKNRFGEGKMITQIRKQKVGVLEKMHGFVESESRNDSKEFAFIHNSTSYMFVQTALDEFCTLGMNLTEDVKFGYYEKHASPGSRILTAEGTQFGLLCRTRKNVLVFRGGTWTSLHHGDVTCMRSFSKSKRYRNLFVVCDDDGVHIKVVVTSAQVPARQFNETLNSKKHLSYT